MSVNSVKINTETQLCAVIGHPVKHSLSPAIHNAAFRACNLNYVYVAFCVEDVQACLGGMRALPSFRGMSVTIPHKMAAMKHLDEVDAMARHVGCVNTVTNEAGRLMGSITDGVGTLRAFAEAGLSLEGARILFVGSGGAVRAVAFAMAELAKPAVITILGRTKSRVDVLAGDLRDNSPARIEDGHLPTDLARAMAQHDIIIQGTPVGMYAHGAGDTCIPKNLLHPRHVVFDMVYRPMRTRLIQDAEAVGCKTILGLEMLVNQAVLQFETWTGVSAPRTVMRDALVGELNASEDAAAGNEAAPRKGTQ